MNSLIYNTEYINRINEGSILDDIEKLCKESFLFINTVKLFFYNIRTKIIVNRLVKNNAKVVKFIYKYDFAGLRELENISSELLKSLNNQYKLCVNCNYSRCKNVFINTLYIPLSKSLELTIKSINDAYHFNAKEIFNTDEELKRNNETLKVFADIWDYETPEEDKELIFNHNAESKQIK